MSEIEAVYTCTDPANIAALHATRATVEATRPLREAFLADFPGTTLYGHEGRIDAVQFDREPDLKVWRKVTGRNAWMKYWPRAKGAEAAVLLGRLQAMSVNDRTSFTGMPDHAGWFSRPGYQLVGDTIWLVWGCSVAEVEKNPSFDPAIWQRRKISEYYAMRESLPAEVAS